MHKIFSRIAGFKRLPADDNGKTQPTRLVDLPPEILLVILGRLTDKQLGRMGRVCRMLYIVSGDDRLWQPHTVAKLQQSPDQIAKYSHSNLDWVSTFRRSVQAPTVRRSWHDTLALKGVLEKPPLVARGMLYLYVSGRLVRMSLDDAANWTILNMQYAPDGTVHEFDGSIWVTKANHFYRYNHDLELLGRTEVPWCVVAHRCYGGGLMFFGEPLSAFVLTPRLQALGVLLGCGHPKPPYLVREKICGMLHEKNYARFPKYPCEMGHKLGFTMFDLVGKETFTCEFESPRLYTPKWAVVDDPKAKTLTKLHAVGAEFMLTGVISVIKKSALATWPAEPRMVRIPGTHPGEPDLICYPPTPMRHGVWPQVTPKYRWRPPMQMILLEVRNPVRGVMSRLPLPKFRWMRWAAADAGVLYGCGFDWNRETTILAFNLSAQLLWQSKITNIAPHLIPENGWRHLIAFCPGRLLLRDKEGKSVVLLDHHNDSVQNASAVPSVVTHMDRRGEPLMHNQWITRSEERVCLHHGLEAEAVPIGTDRGLLVSDDPYADGNLLFEQWRRINLRVPVASSGPDNARRHRTARIVPRIAGPPSAVPAARVVGTPVGPTNAVPANVASADAVPAKAVAQAAAAAPATATAANRNVPGVRATSVSASAAPAKAVPANAASADAGPDVPATSAISLPHTVPVDHNAFGSDETATVLMGLEDEAATLDAPAHRAGQPRDRCIDVFGNEPVAALERIADELDHPRREDHGVEVTL
eukprot:TRINITY_DN2738_c0_g1_i2.p1 TRINITY_DN2738_c0_g1~~TRINITY_DN2738_c0_g1_i2.p1  ORF type:complete len:756 (-),score=147.80 TRINITY_DN2738_c0_g1_i2:1201-3468(-)